MLSKRDLLPPEQVEEALAEWRRATRLTRRLAVLAISSATGEGLDELRAQILSALPALPTARPERPPRRSWRIRGRAPRLPARSVRAATRSNSEDDGAYPRYRSRGRLLFERHDVANEEALAYLEQRLNEIGVIAALRAAGFEPGDDVRRRRARV